MDTKMIVGAIVAVIMLTAVAVPILDSMSEAAYDSEPYAQTTAPSKYYTPYTDSLNVTATVSSTGIVIKYTEGEYTVPTSTNFAVCSNLVMRESQAGTISIMNLADREGHSYVLTESDTMNVTIKLSRGILAVALGDRYSCEVPCSVLYMSSATGTYGEYSVFEINHSSTNKLILGGYYDNECSIFTINDWKSGSQDVTLQKYTSGSYASSETATVTWTTEDSGTYKYKISNMTVTDHSELIVHAIVPNEIKEYSPSTVSTLVTLVPVLLAVSIVIGIAYTIYAKRE